MFRQPFFIFSSFILNPLDDKSEKHNNPASHTQKSSPSLKSIKSGGWESSAFIYHNIPARVLFYLPTASNSDPALINESLWQEFKRIGKIFNAFDPDSEVGHLNASDLLNQISISDDMFSVMNTSHRLWLDSNRHFDPTMWQIKQLWQHAEKKQQIPTQKDLDQALLFTGFEKVVLTDEKASGAKIQTDNHQVMFDFGGIVKGYAVDQVRQLLINNGAKAALVQLGGEISAFGSNNGKPWRIGIQHPRQMDKIWGVISAHENLRVSTSGNYRQPLRIDGQSFYHIFSPKTGRPVSEKVLGVTTVSINGEKSNALLDGTATAITVMRSSAGLRLAQELAIEAFILYEAKDGSIKEIMTPGFSNHYEKDNAHLSR
jgi:thiamine biosynthesis lipoprotein